MKNSATRLISAEETYFLRQMNLRPQLKVEECAFPKDKEDTTFHLGAFYNSQIVSIATFVIEDFHIKPETFCYRLRGMSTHRDFHGQGFGRQLLLKAEEILKQKNVEYLWCYARLNAVPFYEKLKFISVGDVIDMPSVGPHKTMYKELNPR